MKNLAAFFLFTFILSACIGTTFISGKGNIVEESIEVAEFNSVELLGAADVEISKGNDFEILLSDYENIIQYHRVTVENGKLIIEKEDPFVQLLNSKAKVKIVIPQTLSSISLSGSGNIDILTQVNAINSINISGSGRVYATNQNNEFGNLSAKISGSGNIELKGTCTNLDGIITGSGKLYLSELHAQNVDCTISGSGNAYVYASNRLNAIITGSGNIEYTGGASVNTQITGSGRVIQR